MQINVKKGDMIGIHYDQNTTGGRGTIPYETEATADRGYSPGITFDDLHHVSASDAMDDGWGHGHVLKTSWTARKAVAIRVYIDCDSNGKPFF